MMTFELKLEKPNVSRAWISAATMGASYFIGTSPVPHINPLHPISPLILVETN